MIRPQKKKMSQQKTFLENLQKGDKIISLNDTAITYFQDLTTRLPIYAEKDVNLSIVRGADTLTINPKVSKEGSLGFGAKMEDEEQVDTRVKYSLGESFAVGMRDSREALVLQLVAMGKLVTGKLNFMKSVSSPIGIAKAYGADLIWERFWYFTGLLSFVLAIMNLLPIPALDGGHCVFLIIEMLRGKPLSDKALMRAQVVGFAIIMALMAFAFASDIFFK